jgi:hypothetical protein
MNKLTRERIEARRAIVESTSGTVHSVGTAELLALCDLALQSLPAEPRQTDNEVGVAAPSEGVREALEELVRLHDMPFNSSRPDKTLRERVVFFDRAWSAARTALAAPPQQSGMVETPRTDAVALDQREGVTHPDLHETYMAWTDYWALRELSRQLERELNAHQPGASPAAIDAQLKGEKT